MSEQKTIFEYDKLPVKRYAVKIIEITDECCCLAEETILNNAGDVLDRRTCYATEGDFYKCHYCGIPMCIDCMEEESAFIPYCQDCANLPVSIRDKISYFRQEINR